MNLWRLVRIDMWQERAENAVNQKKRSKTYSLNNAMVET